MKEFGTLAEMALHLGVMEKAVEQQLRHGLGVVASAIQKTAKDEIGHYQRMTGPFAAWAPLAESTKEERKRLGYTPDDPGLRSGEMRDSIQKHVGAREAVVGSDDQNLVYFELGTNKQPPRSVLGMAIIRNRELIEKELGRAVVRGMTGSDPIGGNYDF